MKLNLSKKKIIILGTNGVARLAAKEIKKNDMLGYEIAGYLTNEKKKIGKKLGEFKVIGEIKKFKDVSNELGIKDVIIALPKISQKKMIEVIEECEKSAETIRIIPNLGNLFTMGVEIDSFGDVLSLSVPRNLIKPWNIFVKYVFELIFVSMLSIILLPIFLIIALAIKLESPGPILYVQKRLGKQNKAFKFFKFRSMYIEGDSKLEEFLRINPKIRKEWEKFQKIKDMTHA
ncbi:unnamed protein product, partial [marine sediment metagenome]